MSSILGIWHLGATYVPLDLGLPSSRLAAMIKDCAPTAVLVDESTMMRLDEIDCSNIPSINVASLDLHLPHSAQDIVPKAETWCAVLYTSGSSGTPKGVVLKHDGLRNFAEMTAPLLGLEAEIVLQQTSSVFDLSLIQITTALCHGGTLCLIPWNQRGDAISIGDAMVKHNVTLTCATPSEYRSWLNYGKTQFSLCKSWRRILAAGEPIPSCLPARLSSTHPDARFYNLYGPSESSLAATAMQVTLPSKFDTWQDPIPAGLPLPNYTVYVLDPKMRPVPVGVQGEIYIGGAGVGAGYLNQPTLTAEAFIPDTFIGGPDNSKGGTRLLHRTGDIGRWDRTGALLVEGRTARDRQIKLRGLRIDLAEVENAITRVAEETVSELAVSVRSSPRENDEFLVAHVVFDERLKDEDINQEIVTISSKLRHSLPQYMCPAIIRPVPSLPKLNSGKVDRSAVAALPLTEATTRQHTNSTACLTESAKRLSLLWQEIITPECPTNENQFLPHTDFFYAGGNSMRLLTLQARIRDVFGVQISILDMFEYSTLAEMARCVEGATQDEVVEPDWDKETSLLPDFCGMQPLPLATSHMNASTVGRVVVLTGATGSVDRILLKALVRDANVRHIHCLGVRNAARHHDLSAETKVTLHTGDLSLPKLGLPDQEARLVFSEADLVIHNGAEVSYLKSYNSLRNANVQSTRELLRMCAPRMSAFHYISTTSVENGANHTMKIHRTTGATQEATGPVSSDTVCEGRLAGLGFGYVKSKQISEQLLLKLKTQYPDWPIWIHRPSLIIDKDKVHGGPSSVLESLQYYSSLLGAVPILPGSEKGLATSGLFNVMSMDAVVSGILSTAMSPTYLKQAEMDHTIRHIGDEELDLSDLLRWTNIKAADCNEKTQNGTMKGMDLIEWVSKADELGMDSTIVAFIKAVAIELAFH